MEYQANGNDTEIWAYSCVYHGHRGHSTFFFKLLLFLLVSLNNCFFQDGKNPVSYMALKRTEISVYFGFSVIHIGSF